MTADTGVQMNQEVTGQTDQTSSAAVEPDYKTLYNEEIANSKKLRARAQDAEFRIQENLKAQETQKIKQLKQNEKFKELYEQTQAKLDEISPYKERWETYEANERESLLSQLPEEDREMLSQKDLDTLKYIVSKQTDSKPKNPQNIPGQARVPVIDKPWGEMNDQERRAYYEQAAMKGWK